MFLVASAGVLKILIGGKGSLKSSQLASGGEEHVDGTGPGDVVRTGKMSGVTAGENALPVIDGVGEGEGVHGDATGSRTGPRW